MLSSVKPTPQWTINASQRVNFDPLLDSLVLLTEHFGNPCSPEALTAGLPISSTQLTPELLSQAASRAGLSAKLVRKGLNELPTMLLPCILMLKDKNACVLQELNLGKNKAIVTLPETGGEEQLSIEELESNFVGYLFLIKQQYRGDRNFDVHINDSTE
ncbi:MAG: cysteine peptidase family C39 domain-containing protein, partial [Sinobacterium sp.]